MGGNRGVRCLPVRCNYDRVDELVVDKVADNLEDILLLGHGELGRQTGVEHLRHVEDAIGKPKKIEFLT